MHKTNEKISARAKETGNQVEYDSGRDRDAGCESRSTRCKQERISRTYSPQSVFTGDGHSVIGGILRQLIQDYTDQLAFKHEESKRLEEEKKRVDAEADQLNTKIQEFNTLLEQLEADNET